MSPDRLTHSAIHSRFSVSPDHSSKDHVSPAFEGSPLVWCSPPAWRYRWGAALGHLQAGEHVDVAR